MSANWWEAYPRDEQPQVPQAQSANWWDQYPVAEPSQPQQPERSLIRSIAESPLGAGELLLSGATSTLASIPAGLAGLATAGANLFRDQPVDAADVVTGIRDRFTYEPRSDSAQQIGRLIGEGAQWVDRKAVTPALAKIGEVSPTAENVVRTAVPAVAEVVGTLYGGGLVARSAKQAVTRAPRVSADDVVARMGQKQSAGAAGASVDLSRVSPELRAAIEAAHARGEKINPTVLARHVEAESLPVPIRLTEGQATQDATIISNEMNRRGRHEMLAQHFAAQNKALGENLRAIREAVGPNVFTTDMVGHGETLINAYRAKNAAAQADIAAKYAALRQAAGGDLPVDAKRVWDTVESRLKKDLLFEHAPKSIMVQLRAMRDRGMNFEQFEAMRTNLAEIQRSHTASGLERRAAGVIRQALEDLPLQGNAAGLKSLADEARAAARAQFKALEADPAYAAAVEGKVTPDQFVRKFVIGGSRDHVAIMRKNLEGDETALQTMGVAVLDYLRDQARLNPWYEGNFAAASFGKAVRQLDPKLQHILTPEAREVLNKLVNVSNYVTHQPRGSFVNKSNTFVSMAGDAAMRTAEGVTNFKFGGLPVGTLLRSAGERLRQKREVQQSLAPGAGITYVEKTTPQAAREADPRMAVSSPESPAPQAPQAMQGELMPREPLALPAPPMIAGSRSAPGTAFSREQMGLTPDVELAGALHPGAARQAPPQRPAALPLLPPRDAPPIVVDAQGRAALAPELAAYLDEIGLSEVRGARQPRAEPEPGQNLFAMLARQQEIDRAGAEFDAQRAAAAAEVAARGGIRVEELPRSAMREIVLESPPSALSPSTLSPSTQEVRNALARLAEPVEVASARDRSELLKRLAQEDQRFIEERAQAARAARDSIVVEPIKFREAAKSAVAVRSERAPKKRNALSQLESSGPRTVKDIEADLKKLDARVQRLPPDEPFDSPRMKEIEREYERLRAELEQARKRSAG